MKKSELRQLIREEISKVLKEETTPSREEMFNDFEQMAKDLEAKTGAHIDVVKFPNQFRFHTNGDMIGWWGGQFDIPVQRINPSPKSVKQAYDAANKWVASFPERYADYLSWKEKGEEAFYQEVERRRKEQLGGSYRPLK